MKLGRKPAVYNLKTLRSAIVLAQHFASLGLPPSNSDDWVSAVDKVLGGNWGMMGNDQYGDCTCADCGHQLELWTANTGTIVIPTRQDILNLYSSITGFSPNDPNSDNGANELDVCEYMKNVGLIGHKLDAFANIDPANINHVKWGIQLFGTVKIGINVPDSAMSQFNSGKPWDVVDGSNIVGGHDVPIVKYTTEPNGDPFWYVVTWGKLQPMTQAFFAKYCEEVHAPLSIDWISQAGTAPNNLNFHTLTNDLNVVAD